MTDVNAQIAPEGVGDMLTLAGTEAFTAIVIELLTAVAGETQAALEVITHVTTSPFIKAEVV